MVGGSSAYNALVVEGGAMRGVFSTGVLDGFLKYRFNPFNLCIGVSSGAGNLAAYLANMPARNLKIYTDYTLRPEFINPGRFICGGHLMDLDWLWEITISEIRLNLSRIAADKALFLVVLADVSTGKAVYKKAEPGDLENALKASSAMPVFYRDFPLVDGRPMADGGLVDPIPVREAISRGARRIMVIRSRPKDFVKKEGFLQTVLLWKLRRFPALARAVKGRIAKYNHTVDMLRNPPRGISIVEICPPDNFRAGRLSRDTGVLMSAYRQGLRSADDAVRQWFLNPQ